MKFCTSCGDTINNKMNFCENCGIKLPSLQEREALRPINENQSIDETQIQKVVNESEPAAVLSQQFEQQVQLTFDERTNKNTEQQSKASSKPKNPMLIVVIMANILVVIGIFAAVVVLMSTPEKDLQKVYSYYNEGDQNSFIAAFNLPKKTIGQAEDFYNEAIYYDWDSVYEQLRKALDEGETELYYVDPYYGNTIYEVAIESKFLFFKRAIFTYHPATIDIDFKKDQLMLTIGENDIVNPREGGIKTLPIIPGVYSYSTMLDGRAYEDSFEVVRQNTNIFSELVDIGEEQMVEVETDDNESNNEYVYEGDIVNESDRAFIKELYEMFRSEYEDAIHYLEPERIKPMIGDAELYLEYKKFIVDHAKIQGYYYRFYENEILSIDPLGNGRFELYTSESFDFTSDEDGTYYYERQKRYTIDSDERHYVIVDIETLHTEKQKY